KVRHALLAGGILGVAPVEGEAQGEQRHAVLLDQPRGDAAGALHDLNLHGLGPGRWKEEGEHGDETGSDHGRAAAGSGPVAPHRHLPPPLQDLLAAALATTSLSASAGSGTSVPVTERRMSACLTSSTVTLRMASGQPLTCSMVSPSSAPSA